MTFRPIEDANFVLGDLVTGTYKQQQAWTTNCKTNTGELCCIINLTTAEVVVAVSQYHFPHMTTGVSLVVGNGKFELRLGSFSLLEFLTNRILGGGFQTPCRAHRIDDEVFGNCCDGNLMFLPVGCSFDSTYEVFKYRTKGKTILQSIKLNPDNFFLGVFEFLSSLKTGKHFPEKDIDFLITLLLERLALSRPSQLTLSRQSQMFESERVFTRPVDEATRLIVDKTNKYIANDKTRWILANVVDCIGRVSKQIIGKTDGMQLALSLVPLSFANQIRSQLVGTVREAAFEELWVDICAPFLITDWCWTGSKTYDGWTIAHCDGNTSDNTKSNLLLLPPGLYLDVGNHRFFVLEIGKRGALVERSFPYHGEHVSKQRMHRYGRDKKTGEKRRPSVGYFQHAYYDGVKYVFSPNRKYEIINGPNNMTFEHYLDMHPHKLPPGRVEWSNPDLVLPGIEDSDPDFISFPGNGTRLEKSEKLIDHFYLRGNTNCILVLTTHTCALRLTNTQYAIIPTSESQEILTSHYWKIQNGQVVADLASGLTLLEFVLRLRNQHGAVVFLDNNPWNVLPENLVFNPQPHRIRYDHLTGKVITDDSRIHDLEKFGYDLEVALQIISEGLDMMQ